MRNYFALHSSYNIVSEGMQELNNYFVRKNEKIEDIPKEVTKINFCGYGNDMTQLCMDGEKFPKLQNINIGVGCFKNVRKVKLEKMDELLFIRLDSYNFINESMEEKNGELEIKNCPKLLLIEMYYKNFNNYKKFEMRDLNELIRLQIEGECFSKIENIYIKGRKKHKK